jgi:hypothetical protein
MAKLLCPSVATHAANRIEHANRDFETNQLRDADPIKL